MNGPKIITREQRREELKARAIHMTEEEFLAKPEYRAMTLSQRKKIITPGEPCPFRCEDCDGIYTKDCSVFDSFYDFMKDKPKANLTVYNL